MSAMLAVVTPEEMAAIDKATIDEMSKEHLKPLEVLISRAGEAVAAKARKMLGKCYGRQVLVLTGKGNNGKDGKEAARRLRNWGAQVLEVAVLEGQAFEAAGQSMAGETCLTALPKSFQQVTLVIDAVCGTGLSRPYILPDLVKSLSADIPVLAVDIPSGVCGLTGQVLGEALRANATVTFGAFKPGLLFGEGKIYSGEVEVADIGLNASGTSASGTSAYVFTDDSLAAMLPKRDANAHKWNAACWVVGGSPGMAGAPLLAASAAYKGGAGYVRLSTPGTQDFAGEDLDSENSGSEDFVSEDFSSEGFISGDLASEGFPASQEVVRFALPEKCWGEAVAQASNRFHSLVVGPGLSPCEQTQQSLQQLLESDAVISGKLAMVIDGGALEALGKNFLEAPIVAQKSRVVLTPHDREYVYLFGSPPGTDRIKATRDLAKATGAVVLLKGSTTVVSHPDGSVLLSAAGDQRLATAGTGDVLAGVIGALLAQGLDAFQAAALGAELHGRAARLGVAHGLVASDICDLLPQAWQPFLFEARTS